LYYSKKKERQLESLYPNTDDIDVAKVLGLSVAFVRKKAKELGLEKQEVDQWTSADMKILEGLYPSKHNDQLSVIFGKSKMEIEHFAFRMGLSKNKDFFSNILITEEEKALLKEWEDAYSSKKMGNSKGNYMLKKILKHMFSLSKIHTEHPVGGLRLDLFLPSLNLAFEYQGIQHTEYNNFHYSSKADFHRAQARDYKKSEIAEAMGISIVYVYHYEKLSIALVNAKIDEIL
jgi:hypothetical protein